MPFIKGNQYGKANAGKKKESAKTIWLLQSLTENGVDLQALLAKSIMKAAKGDRQAMDLAHLLTKLLPLVANAPKSDAGMVQIDTLVINRYDKTRAIESAEGMSLTNPSSNEEGHPPSSIEAEIVNESEADESTRVNKS